MDGKGNLFLRNDTLFGVCEALGEDFGFNPNWLRSLLPIALFFSPVAVVSAYLLLGMVILSSRLAFPVKQECAEAPVQVAAPAANDADHDLELPIAA